MRIHDFLKIYALIVLAHVSAQIVARDFSFLFFTKLLIPLSVLLYNFYFNNNKLVNTLLTSAFAFFLLGNVLMMINPSYDPCRFDTPIFSYSAAFIFLAVVALVKAKWSLQNIALGLSFATINGVLIYLYIIKGLQSSKLIFYFFSFSFIALSFFTFIYHHTSKAKKYFAISGLMCISVSNHILGFCAFREKVPILVPFAMFFYGASLVLFLLGYIDLNEHVLNSTIDDDRNTNS